MKIYKILIIGQPYDKHQIRFITNLKTENPNVQVDFFSFYKDRPMPQELQNYINNDYCLYNHLGTRYGKLWFIYDIIDIIRLRRMFSKIDEYYDVVNIHFPSYRYSFVVNQLKRMSKTIIVTPWGSDIYRRSKLQLYLLKKLYKEADYITAVSEKFKIDIRRILKIPDLKIEVLDIASDTIDYIAEHKKIINVDEAKRTLNVQGRYVVCCGYNGHLSQQHEKIIKAIQDVRYEFPFKVVLFLPFMYGGNNVYKEKILNLVKSFDLDYVLFDRYLDKRQMFLLEQASDMMIHIQSTDASSCTVQEFLLLEKKIINGSWLKYPNLIIGGVLPYFETPDADGLNSVISNSLRTEISIPQATLKYIENCGWKYWRKKWNLFFESFL